MGNDTVNSLNNSASSISDTNAFVTALLQAVATPNNGQVQQPRQQLQQQQQQAPLQLPQQQQQQQQAPAAAPSASDSSSSPNSDLMAAFLAALTHQQPLQPPQQACNSSSFGGLMQSLPQKQQQQAFSNPNQQPIQVDISTHNQAQSFSSQPPQQGFPNQAQMNVAPLSLQQQQSYGQQTSHPPQNQALFPPSRAPQAQTQAAKQNQGQGQAPQMPTQQQQQQPLFVSDQMNANRSQPKVTGWQRGVQPQAQNSWQATPNQAGAMAPNQIGASLAPSSVSAPSGVQNQTGNQEPFPVGQQGQAQTGSESLQGIAALLPVLEKLQVIQRQNEIQEQLQGLIEDVGCRGTTTILGAITTAAFGSARAGEPF